MTHIILEKGYLRPRNMSANTVVPGTEAFHAKMIQCIRTAGLYANRSAVPFQDPLNPTSLTTRQPIFYKNTTETLNNFQVGWASGKSEGKGKGHHTTDHEDPWESKDIALLFLCPRR
jgi:hypothetical protein